MTENKAQSLQEADLFAVSEATAESPLHTSVCDVTLINTFISVSVTTLTKASFIPPRPRVHTAQTGVEEVRGHEY